MDKHLWILVLATVTTCVLGQLERNYDTGPQDRASAYYDYDDYVQESVPTRVRPEGPRKPSVPSLNYYQTDCKRQDRTLPHEKYCDHYYQLNGCANSNEDQAILRACPNGLVYTGNGRQGLLGVCDYPHRVDCNARERHNPPISTEHCDWLYGIFGHETSCTRYWTCWNGTATEQFCIGGLLYNEETHACDWPQNVGGCQKHPLCKDDPNGNVPLGKSCNRYWSCQGGYPRLQRCPAMLVFDKARKRCVSPPTEDCDVPATTPAPEDEQGGDGGRGGQESSGPPQRSRGSPSQLPENRRRFQTQEGIGNFQTPNERQPPLNLENLPFKLPNGAQPLNRPDRPN